jgi:hypothetical protein
MQAQDTGPDQQQGWTRRQLLAVAAALPAGAAALSSVSSDRSAPAAPAVAERGVYLNIPSPLPPLTIHDWDDREWNRYLDLLTSVRFNRLYFYLWQNEQSDFAADPAHKARNRRLHESLRKMIGFAHRRRIKVTFLFCPTFLPRTLWLQRPELHADIEYVRAGFPCICPSRPGSWSLMREVYRHELEWFRQADGFQLWFYDPGGCMCADCRRDITAPLVRQAQEFREMVRRIQPRAEFQISVWPIWEWESRLKLRYGLQLLDRLKEQFGEEHRKIAITDSMDDPRTFLPAAKECGFRTQAFLFLTNVETPFVFLFPQFDYLKRTVARLAATGYTGAFVHSLTPGSKVLNTCLSGLALSNPAASEDELAYSVALLFTGRPEAAHKLAPTLRLWERLILEGSPRPEEARKLCRQVQEAIAALPEPLQKRLIWLPESAQAIEILIEGASSLNDPMQMEALAARFRTLLESKVTFRAYAPQGAAQFRRMAQWLAGGWRREHF